MNVVKGFAGKDCFVAVCKDRNQRIFHRKNYLFYSVQDNLSCISRLLQSNAKNINALSEQILSSDELVWMAEGVHDSYLISMTGSMSLEYVIKNCSSQTKVSQECVGKAHEIYGQGFMKTDNLWGDLRKNVLSDGEYQFGFVYKGKTAVLYNQFIYFENKRFIPEEYSGGWFCSLSKKKLARNSEIYNVFISRLRSGFDVNDLVEKYVTKDF